VVLKDVERAAALDLPIVPLRLDAEPLSKSLADYIGTIGGADATRGGLEAAAGNVIAALVRVNSLTIAASGAWDEFLTYGSPRFRPQLAFQLWLFAGLVVTLVLGLAGAMCDIAALARSGAQLPSGPVVFEYLRRYRGTRRLVYRPLVLPGPSQPRGVGRASAPL
jgi:hypothetical protein